MADQDTYDPETEGRGASTNSSSSRSNPSPFGNSTSGTGSSFTRGDALDPVRQRERNPNSNTAGKPEGGASDTAGRSEPGLGSSSSDDFKSGAPNRNNLEDREKAGGRPDEENGGLYNEGGDKPTKRQRAKVGWAIFRDRRVLAGGGGSIVLGLAVAFLSVSSGPLEFVHIAQLLERFHFSSQQDAEDGRLMKIARYIHDPSKPQNTRLGIIGNAVADHLETQIHDATGLNSKYDPLTGAFEGYAVDSKHENFKDKTNREIIDELVNKYNISESSITLTPQAKGAPEISFNPDTGSLNSVKEYFNQTGFARGLLGEAGLSKISAIAGTRVLRERAGWTFHPIQKLDAQIQAAALKAGKAGIDKLKEQFNKDQVDYVQNGTVTPADGKAQAKTTTDAKGNTGPPAQQSVDNAAGVDGVQTIAQGENAAKPATVDAASSHLTTKITTGGAAALVGAICVMHSIDANMPTLRDVKDIKPMKRLDGIFMNLGSQIQSGIDFSALQAGFYKDTYLDGKDSNGNVTSTWNQARSFQAEEGEPQTGPDLPKGAQVFNRDVPFSAIEGPVTDTACGILGSTFGQIFSIVTGPVSYIVSGEILKDLTSTLADWLSGAPINTLRGAGATDGNYMNYGGRAAAGDQYASAGGVQESSADESTLKHTTTALDDAAFQHKNIAYRIFNTSDTQTLASTLMDNYGSGGVAQSFASMARNFGSIFASVIKVPATMFSSVTHAASTPYDWHGLKAVGFTAADLADQRFDNSFDNACYVVGDCKLANGASITPAGSILGDPSSPNQSYIDRVAACFGDKISYDGSVWQIDFTSLGPPDMYSDSYASGNCKDTAEPWMRIRFWLLDTQGIEGYDCVKGNSSTSDESCQAVGFSSSASSGSSSTTTTTTPGTLPTGTAKDLANQLLPDVQSGKISCVATEASNCPDIQNTATGTSIKTNGCQVDALNASLLGMLLELVQMGHTFKLSALCTGHHDDGLRGHSGGRAADFNTIDGVFMGPDAKTPWDSAKIAAGEKLDQDIASFMPTSTGFGQAEAGGGYPACHPPFPFQSTWPPGNLFPDACHHQHVQVEN